MESRRRRVGLVAGGATVAAGLALAAPATAQAPDPEALLGQVAQTAAVEVADLAVYAKPEQAIREATPLGKIVHYYQLPDATVTLTGDQFILSVAPQQLPKSTVDDTGLVTFEVVALDGSGTPLGSTSASVRAVYDSTGVPQWTDPLAPTEGLAVFPGGTVPADPPRSTTASDDLLGPVTADLTALPGVSLPASMIDDDEIEVPSTNDAVDTNDDSTQQELNATAVTAASCTPGQGAGNVRLATKTVWATVGTGYPVDGNWSTMSYTAGSTADFTATVGVASDSVGYWQQSGTETKARGTGFNWAKDTPESRKARSYQVSLDYEKVAHYYDRCPPSPPYYRSWDPLRYAGTYGENDGIQRPDWNTCRNQASTGDWWRYDSTGASYSLSYGVKMAKTIGIDLSTKRAYNAEAKLGYWVKAGQRLCGNGGNPPGTAGKVMERL